MSSDTKPTKIGLALLAITTFAALTIIVSLLLGAHKPPSPATSHSTDAQTLEAQISASVIHNSAPGIVNALASACSQKIVIHFNEPSAEAILTRQPSSEIYKEIALLKKDCPASKLIPTLLHAYLPPAISHQNATPANAKLIEDFPETTPPPSLLNHSDGAASVTAYKLTDRVTAVLRTYALPSATQNFSSLQLWSNTKSKEVEGTNSIAGFNPHNFVYYPAAKAIPATYFLCKDMAGDMCAYWSTEFVTTKENIYFLSGGIFDNPFSPSLAGHQTTGNADTCEFRFQLLQVDANNLHPIYLNNYQSPCPGGGINAASPQSLNPLSLVDIDDLLRKLGPDPARAQMLVKLVNFKNPDLADDSIKARLVNTLIWAEAIKSQIHPPKLEVSPDKTIASNTQAFHEYLNGELLYLRELHWALGPGINFQKTELQATQDLAQADKLTAQIPNDLINKRFGATNYQNLTFAIIRSQVEVGEDGMPRIATYGTQNGKIFVIHSEKPLINGLYSPVVTVPVVSEGSTTVVLGNGNAIGAEAYDVAPPDEVAGWAISKKYAEQLDDTDKRFAKLNSCLSENINDFSQSGIDAGLLNACQGGM